MIKYAVKRLLQAIPILFAISIFSFLLMRLAPGDPALAYMNPEMELLDIEQIREDMGLNEPIHVQYINWLKNLLQGNLGYSLSNNKPVLDQIVERLPATIGLMGASMIFSLIVGLILGIVATANYQNIIDKAINFLCYAMMSIPSFWFALMLLIIFSLRLGWLPSMGMRTIGLNSFWDLVKHSIMPVAVLSLGRIASVTRYIRSSMVGQLNEEYVTVSYAMGASKREVLSKDILKNSLLPIITILGMSLPSLVGGAFVVESIFGWPGLGMLGMTAITSYDYPIIMGTTMISSIMLVVGNLISDILYAVVDPRIRGAIQDEQ